MEIFSENKQIGDYIVLHCLKETQETRTWSAKQVSVGRAVLIDELKQAYAGSSQSFLADVRAKAAVEHPLVGSIYEASTDRGHCFCAYELLPGDTVAQLVNLRQNLKPNVYAIYYVGSLKQISTTKAVKTPLRHLALMIFISTLKASSALKTWSFMASGHRINRFVIYFDSAHFFKH